LSTECWLRKDRRGKQSECEQLRAKWRMRTCREIKIGGVLINHRAGKLNGVYSVERLVNYAKSAIAPSEQGAQRGYSRNS
jgi:hypothetical protein